MLELDHVTKRYHVGTFGSGELLAVRDVSFTIAPGEIVSLIGESGSGKSTIGRMILRLTGVTSGAIRFEGKDVAPLEGRRLKEYYRHVQGVFQDPFSSYNPIFKADRAFALVRSAYFRRVRASEWRERVDMALESVGLNPGDVLGKYQHQLSGGQLQRLLIARALLLEIRFLVADEVISMLDASTRVDVLNLLSDLKDRGLGILFITHDLSLGNYISERTMILRRGRVVELGPTGKQDWADLADRLTHDRYGQRHQQEVADGRRSTQRAVVGGGAVRHRSAEIGPQDRETDGQRAGQQEGEAYDDYRLVLPDVDVVDVDDVDDRHGKSGHQHSNRHGAEDRCNQGHNDGDSQRDPIRLRTLAGTPRHDRRDQGKRGDRLVGPRGKGLPSSEIRRALILSTDLTEQRNWREFSPTPWAFQP